MQPFDKGALATLLVALVLWVALPFGRWTGLALALAGVLHALRLARWAGHRTFAEPLVTVLHAATPSSHWGLVGIGRGNLGSRGSFGMAGAQHFWMAGAIGLMDTGCDDTRHAGPYRSGPEGGSRDSHDLSGRDPVRIRAGRGWRYGPNSPAC